MAKKRVSTAKKKTAARPVKGVTLSEPELARVRSQILRSVVSELRMRPGGDFAYGYTKSSNENYGKYEKE
jgi:hypothetical protein